ncbi:nuclear factor of activated T-cells, cytoplasmic 1-like, partial [Notothenia coriiceps]|uniref:Nuclear factor of activated T-cells, cytoplasmic 1-like n=1 Tax=Notothenia coriiceps TaxID=8208 RepID=A0A6I9NVX5_9TELE
SPVPHLSLTCLSHLSLTCLSHVSHTCPSPVPPLSPTCLSPVPLSLQLIGYSEQPLSLLLFIGTADDRVLRPHSFYQVHRVTGKTVTTSCLEKMTGGSKVLEIPLLPGNSMAASIDCAGILKLRNADIELKKGEMAIGRKNTRVRVVFRVALPQSDGRMLWLQTTSNAVECCESPVVSLCVQGTR